MLFSAVCGLEHMHKEIVGTSGKHGMAHRDVKAKNILIKNNGECCIGDLGLAIRDDYFKSHNYELEPNPNLQVGTKRYMAPEILSNTIDQVKQILNLIRNSRTAQTLWSKPRPKSSTNWTA